MCGIVGYWDKRGTDASVVGRMAMRIQHRGPDDADVWLDEEAGLALAHRRLSIIDLTPSGHQPMRSGGGCYVIATTARSIIYPHCVGNWSVQGRSMREGFFDPEPIKRKMGRTSFRQDKLAVASLGCFDVSGVAGERK